jgi:hypothetical protein
VASGNCGKKGDRCGNSGIQNTPGINPGLAWFRSMITRPGGTGKELSNGGSGWRGLLFLEVWWTMEISSRFSEKELQQTRSHFSPTCYSLSLLASVNLHPKKRLLAKKDTSKNSYLDTQLSLN